DGGVAAAPQIAGRNPIVGQRDDVELGGQESEWCRAPQAEAVLEEEQLSRVVDEKVKHQAATSSFVVVVSSSVTFTPSLNFTPASTSPTSSWPLTRRQRSWAASKSLSAIASA